MAENNRDLPPVEWRTAKGLSEYNDTQTFMEERVAQIRMGEARELVWLVEHPPLYSAGTSAAPEDLLQPERFRVFQSGRGGQYTYHGPGQRVVYAMLDLKLRGCDVRAYVRDLEEWMIVSLARFGVTGERREGRVGIWVVRKEGPNKMREDKIGAIGVRVRKWVGFHGLALNVAPDLSHFSGIVPCGISEHGVTSLQDLGVEVSLGEVDKTLRETFDEVFQRHTVAI